MSDGTAEYTVFPYMNVSTHTMTTPNPTQCWYIVNFTKKEYLAYKGTPENMYRRMETLFAKDKEDWSKWDAKDEVVWMSASVDARIQPFSIDTITLIRDNFENVYYTDRIHPIERSPTFSTPSKRSTKFGSLIRKSFKVVASGKAFH